MILENNMSLRTDSTIEYFDDSDSLNAIPVDLEDLKEIDLREISELTKEEIRERAEKILKIPKPRDFKNPLLNMDLDLSSLAKKTQITSEFDSYTLKKLQNVKNITTYNNYILVYDGENFKVYKFDRKTLTSKFFINISNGILPLLMKTLDCDSSTFKFLKLLYLMLIDLKIPKKNDLFREIVEYLDVEDIDEIRIYNNCFVVEYNFGSVEYYDFKLRKLKRDLIKKQRTNKSKIKMKVDDRKFKLIEITETMKKWEHIMNMKILNYDVTEKYMFLVIKDLENNIDDKTKVKLFVFK